MSVGFCSRFGLGLGFFGNIFRISAQNPPETLELGQSKVKNGFSTQHWVPVPAPSVWVSGKGLKAYNPWCRCTPQHAAAGCQNRWGPRLPACGFERRPSGPPPGAGRVDGPPPPSLYPPVMLIFLDLTRSVVLL